MGLLGMENRPLHQSTATVEEIKSSQQQAQPQQQQSPRGNTITVDGTPIKTEKQPKPLLWFRIKEGQTVHKIEDGDHLVSFHDMVNDPDHDLTLAMYEEYVQEWYGFHRKGDHKAATPMELIAARKNLMNQINELLDHNVAVQAQGGFEKMLDANLYDDSPEPAAAEELLHTEDVFVLPVGTRFDVNRCTIYGLNALLGGPYFTNLR